MGGMWVRASDIARFESVGSCLPDRDRLGLARSDKQAAVRSVGMKNSISWLLYVAVGMVLSCLMVAIG